MVGLRIAGPVTGSWHGPRAARGAAPRRRQCWPTRLARAATAVRV